MAKVYISPSDQSANRYAFGDTNEAIQCRRIADALEVALKRCGIEVRNNKTDGMAARCEESDRWGADLHVPIHTNAYNKSVTGTRIFCYSKTSAGYKAAHAIFDVLAPLTPGESENVSVNATLYETRVPAAATAYVECEFHDVPEMAKWIIENVEAIGEAICEGICKYFGVEYIKPAVKKYRAVLGEYNTPEEAHAAIGELWGTISTAEEALGRLDTMLHKAQVVG